MGKRTGAEALLAVAGMMFILGICDWVWFGRGQKGLVFVTLGILILVRFAWTKRKNPSA